MKYINLLIIYGFKVCDFHTSLYKEKINSFVNFENVTKWDQNELRSSCRLLLMTILLKAGEDPSYFEVSQISTLFEHLSNIYKWPIDGKGMENVTKWAITKHRTAFCSVFIAILGKREKTNFIIWNTILWTWRTKYVL